MIGAIRLRKCSSGNDDMDTDITMSKKIKINDQLFMFVIFFCSYTLFLQFYIHLLKKNKHTSH